MTKSQHTPGPWNVSTYIRGDDNACILHVTGAGIDIATQPSGHGHNQEDWANARLIAATPELLEALETFEKEFDGNKHWWVARKIRAALAKARGESEAA